MSTNKKITEARRQWQAARVAGSVARAERVARMGAEVAGSKTPDVDSRPDRGKPDHGPDSLEESWAEYNSDEEVL